MRTRLLGLGYYLLVGVVTAGLLVPLLNLRGVHLSVPFDYASDALSGSVHLKTVLEQGWTDFNPRIGAPEGRHGNDFPGADNLHLMAAWVLGLFTDRWAVVLNAYFLLTFPLAAVAAAWFLRVVGLGRVTAAALAILYAFAPYHFTRGEGHLYLAAYYVVPLACVLLYRAVGAEPLWVRRETGRLRWLSLRTGSTVAVLLVLGTASSYYSIFTLALLTGAGFVALLQERRWQRLVGVVAAQGLLVAVMLANMLPNLLYQREHGANLTALARSGRLTEFYALKLSSLLLPARDHRVTALADFRRTYDTTYPLPSEPSALGAVASAGFVLLLAVAVLGMTTMARRREQPSDWWTSQRKLSTLALLGFLLGTVGGLSTFFALFVTDSVRGWNRISIFLALFGLAAFGLVLDRVPGRVWVRASLAGVVLLVGLYDQVPATYPKDRGKVLTAWASDEGFVRQAERVLPAGAMVLQLPYLSFPESSGRVALRDSAPFRMYLHSQTLRWSYGGIKGRPEADWAAAVSDQPGERVAAFASTAGFAAIVVDRFGYTDRGAALERELAQILDVVPLLSADRRFTLWDLREHRAVLEARHSPEVLAEVALHTLRHPVAYAVDFRSARPRIAYDNPLPTPQVVDATVTLVASDRPSQVAVRWPDGVTEVTTGAKGTVVVTRRLTLAPGRSWVEVSTPATATTVSGLRPSQVRYRFRSATAPDAVLAAFRP